MTETKQTETKAVSAPAVPQTPKEKLNTVRGMLETAKKQIMLALPRHMNADRMIRIALTSVQRTPRLLDCHPATLIGAVIQSAQLGLETDGILGQAHLVPFWNGTKQRYEVQLIPGYRGLCELARRSRQVSTIEARVVCAGDAFDYEYGLNAKLIHKPCETPGVPVAFYAVAKFKDGGSQFEVMTVLEVNAIRDKSQGYRAALKFAKDGKEPNTPWVTNYIEMGKKSVIRKICKYIPASPELQQATALEERAEIGIPQDLGILADESETGSGGDTPAPLAEPQRIAAPPAEAATEPAKPEPTTAIPTVTGINVSKKEITFSDGRTFIVSDKRIMEKAKLFLNKPVVIVSEMQGPDNVLIGIDEAK